MTEYVCNVNGFSRAAPDVDSRTPMSVMLSTEMSNTGVCACT